MLGRVLLMLTVGASAVAAAPAPVEQTIRDLEQAQARAAIARDRGALERLFSDDFQIINPSGAVADRNVLLQLLTGGGASPYRSATYTTEQVIPRGDTVVTTGLEAVVPNTGAQAGQTVQRRITHVWVRAGGSWRLRLRHATIVQPPPPG